MALKAETRKPAAIVAAEPPHPLPDRKPQFLVASNGERLVVLFESDYDLLLAAAQDNLEDAQLAASAAEWIGNVVRGEEQTIPPEVFARLTRQNRIRVLREWKGWSQAELAAKVDSTPAYISQLETSAARASLPMLGRIADAFGVSIDLVTPKPHDAPGNDRFAFGVNFRYRRSIVRLASAGAAIAFLDEAIPDHMKEEGRYKRLLVALETAIATPERDPVLLRDAEKKLKTYVDDLIADNRTGADLISEVASRLGWNRARAESLIDSMTSDPDEPAKYIYKNLQVTPSRLREIAAAIADEPLLSSGGDRLIVGLRARGLLPEKG